jgi:hypothetical protein
VCCNDLRRRRRRRSAAELILKSSFSLDAKRYWFQISTRNGRQFISIHVGSRCLVPEKKEKKTEEGGGETSSRRSRSGREEEENKSKKHRDVSLRCSC